MVKSDVKVHFLQDSRMMYLLMLWKSCLWSFWTGSSKQNKKSSYPLLLQSEVSLIEELNSESLAWSSKLNNLFTVMILNNMEVCRENIFFEQEKGSWRVSMKIERGYSNLESKENSCRKLFGGLSRYQHQWG